MPREFSGPSRKISTPLPMEHQPSKRLDVQLVERLHSAIGGDPITEEVILRFIAEKYGARNLLYLPPAVAGEILKRPADFIRAAKRYCHPELAFGMDPRITAFCLLGPIAWQSEVSGFCRCPGEVMHTSRTAAK